MIRAEFQIVIAGASSLFAAMGMSGSATSERPRAPAAYAAIAEQDHAERREISRAADGLFYLPVGVNGRTVRFLVDTGANVTILTPEDAARSGLRMQAGSKNALSTVGGTAHARWTQVDALEVADHRIEHLDVAVVSGGAPVSLLGQDVLSQLGSITLSGDRLTIN